MSSARQTIRTLAADGLSAAEIARRLGLARATVDHHLNRETPPPAPQAGESPTLGPGEMPGSARTTVDTRRAVSELLALGVSRAEVARRLSISKATVSYHARRLGLAVDERCARRYDWVEVQRYYDVGHSVRECIARFGFSSASWFKAVQRGDVRARPAAIPSELLFAADTYRGRYHLKLRLLAEGLRADRCERCGIDRWRGQPITMALHHINGVRVDNRLENLQLLCPNCHSQTDNFAGRNRPKGRGTPRARDPPAGRTDPACAYA